VTYRRWVACVTTNGRDLPWWVACVTTNGRDLPAVAYLTSTQCW